MNLRESYSVLPGRQSLPTLQNFHFMLAYTTMPSHMFVIIDSSLLKFDLLENAHL